MRAAMIEAAGALPVVVEMAPPEPREGATLVNVDIASIGPTDIARAEGSWRPFPGPHVVNGEGIGHLDDGTRVYFFHSVAPYGGVAERTLVPTDWVWPIDDIMSDEQGPVIGSAGTAALIALETARVKPGDRVLILGATGVVGQAGLQIARAMGAGFVAAAGRSEATLARLKGEGLADATAQIGAGDDLAALGDISGQGWNVVLDIIFGPPAEAALKTSAKGARISTMGKFAGSKITIEAADLGGRSISSIGTNEMSGAERRAAYARLSSLVAQGQLRVETKTFGLDDVGRAWAALQSGAHAKILVRP